jgi:hypothetical protein
VSFAACGLRSAAFARRGCFSLAISSHGKTAPRPSASIPHHGLAACPAHDVAYGTGMLTVNGGLRIRLARRLADAAQADPLTRQYYSRPPLRGAML